MRALRFLFGMGVFIWLAPASWAADAILDRMGDALMISSRAGTTRLEVSGSLDVEGYAFPQPTPGLIFAGGNELLQSRLSVFLDADLGP